MTAHCHKVIRKVAQALAGELYEVLMGDNFVRAEWKKQNPECTEKQLCTKFVARNWGRCIETARATLALQLRDPNIPEKQKEEIVEVLALDNTLRRGRR